MEKKSWFLESIKYLLLDPQAQIFEILKELLEWCIDNDEHGKHILRDEDKVKNLNEMLSDLQIAEETVNRHLKFVVAKLQNAVSRHDDESAGPSDHNDHGGDDQNVPTAAADDETVSVGKAPEIATSSPSSGSSSSGNEA